MGMSRPSLRVTPMVTALLLAGLTAAGCGSTDPDGPPSRSADAVAGDRARAVVAAWRDDDLLARWRSSFVPAQGLTVEPDWTPREHLKAAFYGGWVRTTDPLPDVAGSGTVTYAAGPRPLEVRTVGADTAYREMVNPRAGECPPPDGGTGCGWLTITGATLRTAMVATARGSATVPVWAFAVQGLAEPLLRVAVEPAAEVSDFEPELPPLTTTGSLGLASGQDVVRVQGSRLTVRVGIGSCDGEPVAHVTETAELVVVGATVALPTGDMACDAMLNLRELSVQLDAPLGDRPVLDLASGRPLLPALPLPGQG
jgi:hypothetical protein